MTEGATEVGNRVLKQLEGAWNSGDGEAFGAPFVEDAEFVNIRGERHTGRTAIAKGHQAIFDSLTRTASIGMSRPSGSDWQVVMFHNTLVATEEPRPV